MALKKCFECGKEVSDTATKCPHCGAHNPTENADQSFGDTLIVIGVLVGIILVFLWAANSGVLPASWVDWLVE